jgi:hypothetical protein
MKKKRNAENRKIASSNFKACVIAVLMMALLFLPCIRYDFAYQTVDGMEVESYYMSILDFTEISEPMRDNYINVGRESHYWNLFDIQKEILSGEGDEKQLLNTYYHTLAMGVGRADINPLLIAVMLVSAALLLVLAMLMKRCLSEALLQAAPTAKKSLLKWLATILAFVDFGLMISIQQTAKQSVFGGLASTFRIDFSVVPLVLFVVAIAMFINSLTSKRVNVIDSEYDNPDVAYAPYVVK